jgi:hypothetical protein
MAIAQVHELRGWTKEGYDQAMGMLNLSGPPPGSLVHMSGPMEGGWRIVEVWESEEAATAFYSSAAFQEMAKETGVQPDVVATWPMENVLK